jgi:hypothetical protein
LKTHILPPLPSLTPSAPSPPHRQSLLQIPCENLYLQIL